MQLHYAGIGSRRVDPSTCVLMTQIALRLNGLGWILRSGHALGSDRAFEEGAGGQKEIFLKGDATPEALLLASQVHPRWDLCDKNARKLHARNCYQVLGRDLCTPVKMVICWTPDGAESEGECSIETGGTATSIRIASRYAIPIFNLQRGASDRLLRVKEIVEKWTPVPPSTQRSNESCV